MSTQVERRIERITNSLRPQSDCRRQNGDKAALADRMAYYQIPGVSIAVANNYRNEWARGFGVREWGKPGHVTDHCLFQAGSISEAITALAVLRLVQEGRLDLDQDVNQHLTSWQIPANGEWQPRVTLRQLLSHCAGLTAPCFPGYLSTEMRPNTVQILNGECPATTPPIQVDMIPGIQFRYSAGGSVVVQQLLMDVLDKPFPTLMQELVLVPLAMNESTFEQPPPIAWAKCTATAHSQKYQAVAGKWHIYPEMAAAGLWTTPSDLIRAGLELQLALQGESNRFLSPELTAEMLSPQAEADTGLGFFLAGEGEATRFEREGANMGFMAQMVLYKHQGKGAVVMINANRGHLLISEIMRGIAREYQWPDNLPPKKETIDLSPELLATYSGEYTVKDPALLSAVRFTIALEKGKLALRVGRQPPIPLTPQSDIAFFTPVLGTTVTFHESKTGEITGFTLCQEGKETHTQKKSEDSR